MRAPASIGGRTRHGRRVGRRVHQRDHCRAPRASPADTGEHSGAASRAPRLRTRVGPDGIDSSYLREPRRALAEGITELARRCDTLPGAFRAAHDLTRLVCESQHARLIDWDSLYAIRRVLQAQPQLSDAEAAEKAHMRVRQARFAAAPTPRRGMYLLGGGEEGGGGGGGGGEEEGEGEGGEGEEGGGGRGEEGEGGGGGGRGGRGGSGGGGEGGGGGGGGKGGGRKGEGEGREGERRRGRRGGGGGGGSGCREAWKRVGGIGEGREW